MPGWKRLRGALLLVGRIVYMILLLLGLAAYYSLLRTRYWLKRKWMLLRFRITLLHNNIPRDLRRELTREYSEALKGMGLPGLLKLLRLRERNKVT